MRDSAHPTRQAYFFSTPPEGRERPLSNAAALRMMPRSQRKPGSSALLRQNFAPLKNHIGTMHGGMLYALGEVAAAVAMTELLVADRASLYAITRQGEIAYLKPARGAISSSCQVSMSRSEILSALEHQPSVDVPVTVTLNDAADVVVARLHFSWYVAPLR